VAVSTQGLQISRIIVATVSVYVVYVELAAMFRNESAMLTGILLVDGIWILVLLYVSFIDSPAAKATSGS
jgi:DMSO/TMAO reductase YedYZ heme-binding membrane subunit